MFERKRMKGMESTKTEESSDFEESSFYMSLSRMFSAKGLRMSKQHKQTLCSTASDTFKAQHKRTFFSFCWRHDLCGILFSLWLLFQSQCWLGFWQFSVSFSNGKEGKLANWLQTGQLKHYLNVCTIQVALLSGHKQKKTLCSCRVTRCVALMWFWHPHMTLP